MKIDVHSATWRIVRDFCDANIDKAKDALITDLPKKQTAKLRAQIDAWQQVLNLKETEHD